MRDRKKTLAGRVTGWLALALLAVSSATAQNQIDETGLDTSLPKGTSPEQIIQQFAAREKEFKEARDNYTYRQSVKVQTIDEGGSVDGEFQQVVDIQFDQRGRRVENVVYAPQSTLQRVSMTREDFADIEQRLPFVLTSDDLPEYNIMYVGQQPVDELTTFVFDVSPKRIAKGRRYFEGRIWVDDRDLQIVKTFGKNVPDVRGGGDRENLSPRFTTYREQVDGKYWFPTYTRADDVLKFSNGDIRIRQIIKYTDYKRFGAKSKIIFDGQEVEKPQEPKK